MLQYLHLLELIIKHGNLRHSGYDFNKTREEGLKQLGVPGESTKPVKRSFLKSLLWKNAFTRRIHSELAFLKSSLTNNRGAHLYDAQHNLVYIRIPKSASTSVSLLMLSGIYDDISRLDAREINFLIDANLKPKLSPAEEASTFFTIVRNPFARIVSVYRSYFEGKQDHFLYEDYLFGSFQKAISFPEFVRRLSLIPDRLKDQHLKPQHLFLQYYERRKLRNITVLKLEEPDSISNFLNQYNLSIPHLNKSNSTSDFRSYYDEETARLVAEIYKMDLENFGYDTF